MKDCPPLRLSQFIFQFPGLWHNALDNSRKISRGALMSLCNLALGGFPLPKDTCTEREQVKQTVTSTSLASPDFECVQLE